MFDAFEIDSRYLHTTRRVTVWLPPGFTRRGRALLPVLYLNDGQNLFDPARSFAGATWQVADTARTLVQRALIAPLLIVGIDHGRERRAREYLPVEDARNPGSKDPLGRAYRAFVTREVMPAVARRFPVAPGASHTGIGGSSYGAVSALDLVLARPGLFGRLLLESPSLYVGGGQLLRRARLTSRWPSRVCLGVGTAETRREDWNEETVANVRRLEAVLHDAGFGAGRLRVTVEEGATHNEEAWARRLPAALQFLYGV